MKKLAVILLFCIGGVYAQQHFSNANNMVIWLGADGFLPTSMKAAAWTWAKQRYDYIISGQSSEPGTTVAGTKTCTYTDIAVATVAQVEKVYDALLAEGYDPESGFIHTSIDMTRTAGPFGDTKPTYGKYISYYDRNSAGAMEAGLIKETAGVFADVTAGLGVGVTIPEILYVGEVWSFAEINFTLTTARVGGSVAYDYWDGNSWEPLATNFADTTSGLTTDGKVSWNPTTDWAKTVINGSRSKYFIRITVAGASTSPVTATIQGDDWIVASGSNNSRGWDSSDANIINAGTPHEFNPTPPATAKAKYRYQARVPSHFYPGYVYLNWSWEEAGVRPAIYHLLADTERHQTTPLKFQCAFMDDPRRLPDTATISSPANPYTYFDVTQTPTPAEGMLDDQADGFLQFDALLETTYGSGFDLGGNGPIPDPGTYGDYTHVEANLVIDSHRFWCQFTDGAFDLCPYDWALTANNPNETRYYYLTWSRWAFAKAWAPRTMDSIPSGGTNPIPFTDWHYVDEGNRVPIAMLAMYLLGLNDNTGFSFMSGPVGINAYFQTDDVYYIKATTTLAAQVDEDTAANTDKDFQLTSATGCSGAGQYLWLGDKTSGELVQAMAGKMIWTIGGQNVDKTWDWGNENNVYGLQLQGGPNIVTFFYDDPFTQLDFTFVQATGGGGGLTAEYWNGTAWTSLSVTDGTASWTQNGSITWTAPGDWASRTSDNYYNINSQVETFTGYAMRITTNRQPYMGHVHSPQWVKYHSRGGASSTTTRYSTTFVYNTYSAGSPVSCVKWGHLGQGITPSSADAISWVRWFPAMGAVGALGTPSGARQIPWKTGGAPDNMSGIADCDGPGSDVCSDIWRRDFTGGIVLVRPFDRGYAGPGEPSHIEEELDTPSDSIDLGGTYYPLKSDGTTGAGITSITLRALEGAILLTDQIQTPGTIKSSSFNTTIR